MITTRPLFLSIVLLACSRTAAPETATELPAAPSSGPRAASVDAASAREVGCPPPERIGVVTDVADLLGAPRPVFAFSGPAIDIDGEAAGLSEARRKRELSEAEARALGDRSAPEPIWVLEDDVLSGCRLEPGRRFLVIGTDPWEQNPLLFTEALGDCDIPKGPGRIAVRSAGEPASCAVRAPSDGEGILVRRADAPRELRDAFEGTACAAPCELRTNVIGFSDRRERRLEWVVTAHVHVRPNVDECGWEHEDFMTLLARDGQGAVAEVEASGLDEVLLDRGSVVAFVDREVHRFEVWAWPRAATPRLVHTVQYRWAHEEDFEHLALSPYCGP